MPFRARLSGSVPSVDYDESTVAALEHVSIESLVVPVFSETIHPSLAEQRVQDARCRRFGGRDPTRIASPPPSAGRPELAG